LTQIYPICRKTDVRYNVARVFTCLNTCAEFKMETLTEVRGFPLFQRLQLLRSRIKKVYKYGMGQKRLKFPNN